ncbi:hypothetical protein [Nocardioides bruguierae]|uniref:Uncharacterized protein n=1 Tax=Nocardioides bruguierae TaxID=2945102 RepID=A0A9X2D6V7_9ACTN|nr:hypothetical protein [Nocardioides bruguierae]MCM0620251.1 hypothetical protein [Nocardioides bruguierae]
MTDLRASSRASAAPPVPPGLSVASLRLLAWVLFWATFADMALWMLSVLGGGGGFAGWTLLVLPILVGGTTAAAVLVGVRAAEERTRTLLAETRCRCAGEPGDGPAGS